MKDHIDIKSSYRFDREDRRAIASAHGLRVELAPEADCIAWLDNANYQARLDLIALFGTDDERTAARARLNAVVARLRQRKAPRKLLRKSAGGRVVAHLAPEPVPAGNAGGILSSLFAAGPDGDVMAKLLNIGIRFVETEAKSTDAGPKYRAVMEAGADYFRSLTRGGDTHGTGPHGAPKPDPADAEGYRATSAIFDALEKSPGALAFVAAKYGVPEVPESPAMTKGGIGGSIVEAVRAGTMDADQVCAFAASLHNRSTWDGSRRRKAPSVSPGFAEAAAAPMLYVCDERRRHGRLSEVSAAGGGRFCRPCHEMFKEEAEAEAEAEHRQKAAMAAALAEAKGRAADDRAHAADVLAASDGAPTAGDGEGATGLGAMLAHDAAADSPCAMPAPGMPAEAINVVRAISEALKVSPSSLMESAASLLKSERYSRSEFAQLDLILSTLAEKAGQL